MSQGLSHYRLRLECWKMKSKEIPRAQQTFTPLIISVFFLYTHAACYPTLRCTIVCRMIKMQSERSTCYCVCVSMLNVLMHILIHKYCIGCSVVWRCSCFQLFPLSRLCLFSCLVRWSRKMLLMIWFDMSLLYAGLNIIPSPCQGRDCGQLLEWSPGLLPMITVCLKSYNCHWSLNR